MRKISRVVFDILQVLVEINRFVPLNNLIPSFAAFSVVTGTNFTKSGNGEPGNRVWERVYSGNPHETSKWRKREKKKDWGLVFDQARLELDRQRNIMDGVCMIF